MKSYRNIVLAAALLLLCAPAYAQDICTADTPISDAQSWCAPPLGTDANGNAITSCGTTPEAAVNATLRMMPQEPGLLVCGCLPTANRQAGDPYDCTYSVPSMNKNRCAFKIQVWPQCPKGSVSQPYGKCMLKSALDYDKAVSDKGGDVLRDVHGNILSVIDVNGAVVETQGGHDAYGRPAWIENQSNRVEVQWAQGGDVLPTAVGLGGAFALLQWHDPVQWRVVQTGETLHVLKYSSANGSLIQDVMKTPTEIVYYGWYENGRPVRTRHVPLAPPPGESAPKTAPALPGALPGVQPALGVHPIGGATTFQLPVIAAGAILLYPPAREGLARFIADTWHHCLQVADNPEDVNKAALDKYFAERQACYAAVDAKYKGQPRNDPKTINDAARDLMDCIASADRRRSMRVLGVPEGELIPLRLP